MFGIALDYPFLWPFSVAYISGESGKMGESVDHCEKGDKPSMPLSDKFPFFVPTTPITAHDTP
jgi:hypothetical protein